METEGVVDVAAASPAPPPSAPAAAPAAVAMLRAPAPGMMERSMSEDIRGEREELKAAAEQTLNAIVDLNLDCTVKWVSPSWADVVGTQAESVIGSRISDLIASENKTVFRDVLDSMQRDDSRSHRVRFAVVLGPLSKLLPLEELRPDPADNQPHLMDLEGQGIMVYDSVSGGESHTMWMLRPWIAPREIKIDLPTVIVDSLGSGAEVLASYLTQLAEIGLDDPENPPTPPAVLCRICERDISPWWFEKHTDLCLQEHRAELDVQMAQESLTEHRHAIVRVLDALEARQSRHTGSPDPAATATPAVTATAATTMATATLPVAEYKAMPIGPPPSTRSSPGSSSASSRDRSGGGGGGYGHNRNRSFAVRRPQARIVELLVDLCDTAIEISTPALKESAANGAAEIRSHSPQSDCRISQVLQWQSPGTNTLDQEQGLALLCADTERAAKAKVEAVFRHRKIIEYAERIRVEFSVLVQDCINEAIRKAARIAAGRLSDSTDYDEDDLEAQESEEEGEAEDDYGQVGYAAPVTELKGEEAEETEEGERGDGKVVVEIAGEGDGGGGGGGDNVVTQPRDEGEKKEDDDAGPILGQGKDSGIETGDESEPASRPSAWEGSRPDHRVESAEGTSALVAALRDVSLRSGTNSQSLSRSRPVSMIEGSRTSSGSPRECRTPRSHANNTTATGHVPGATRGDSKRESMLLESDAGDSDSSFRSSSVAPRHPPRTDSPVSEFGDLRRAANVRQHHRKSLILPGTASPRRQESPSRLTQPSSPLRIHHNKPRSFPFSHEGLVSPEASPMLPSSELSSPAALSLQNHHHNHHHHHHRRQSSAAMSEFVIKAAPPSPHLGLYSHHNNSSNNNNSGAGGQHGVPGQPRPAQPSIKDFEIIKPISKGAFGSVYLSKKKSTAEYFAIKVLKKADMVAKNQVGNVKAERAIMMWQGESEFVAKLYWTFSSKDYLYLVMEYLNGGDCASLIKVLGGLPEDWVKKYLAEVVLGVEHLHSRGIIHRDLKPDNLLIDHRGHLKLTDFGLSRMGLVGRQKRALSSENADPTPDLLKQGPFARPTSMASSRSTSMDLHGPSSGQQTLGGGGGGSSCGLGPSPGTTPQITPDLGPTLGQPSYFSLGSSSHGDRRLSGHRSDSGGSEGLTRMLNSLNTFSLSEPEPVALSQLPQASPQQQQQQQQQQQPRSPMDEGQGRPAATALPQYDSISSIPQEAAHHGQQQRQSSSELQGRNTPPHTAAPMMPPPMALFDPEDTNRRFVGTPDYLAPETIKGEKQDETSDWWSVGCIMYEFLYGVPPFNDETAELVFENILARRIQWPDDHQHDGDTKGDADHHDAVGDEDGGEPVSDEAKDLINKLLCMEPRDRLGSNRDDKFPSGGDEIRNHSWFNAINWETLLQDEAQFVPQPENPEDTEYFDSRGAVLQSFAEEVEDHATPPTSAAGSEYPDRPHDALSRVRSQFNAVKRNLMPLHIPPHIRDHKSRRLSEPVVTDDFGSFAFKNLPVLEKANKDVIQKLRAEALALQNKGGSGGNSSAPNSTTSSSSGSCPGFSGTGSSCNNSAPSPGSHQQLSREGSPVMTATTVGPGGSGAVPTTQHLSHPVQRTSSCAKPAHRRQSPSGLGHTNSSPNRISQPSSPLLVSFVAGPGSEGRRKASSNSSSLSQYDIPRVPPSLQKAATTVTATAAATPSVSPVKGGGRQQQQQHASTLPPASGPPPPLSLTLSPNRTAVAVGASLGSVGTPRQTSGSTSGRSRSLTVGSQSQDGSPVACDILAGHRNRRSQVFDLSPSSSDNEGGSETKNALLRVQRRRQNSRRLSQVVSLDAGPVFRPLDVLICEDHPVSRMVMEKLLEKLRCRTISVANGSEAVRYSMSDIKFDVIFLEYKLPQISGADVARMIRETKNANSHTPIVAITAYLKELQAPHYFDSLIEKPISGAKLGEVLKTLCHWRPELPSRGQSLSLLSSSLPLPRRLSQQQPPHSQSNHPHHPHHPPHGQPHRQISTNLRQSSSRVSDSGPNSALSSPAYTHYAGRPGSSPLASAREGSLGSSLYGDPEFVSTEDIPVLAKGGAADDREGGHHEGQGVREDETAQPDDAPPTLHTILDPVSQPIAGSAHPGGRGRIHPPPARFADRLKPRREARDNREGTDSADDEDEEYSARVASGPASAPATVQAGEKMFRAKGAFPSSKLAIEMMRADSHDSFTSEAQTALEVALPVITCQPNKDAEATAITTPDPSSGPCDPTP